MELKIWAVRSISQARQVSLYLRTFRLTMSGIESHTEKQRTFPPLYKSGGDESKDRLAFFHVLERLKARFPIFVPNPLRAQRPLVITSRLKGVQAG